MSLRSPRKALPGLTHSRLTLSRSGNLTPADQVIGQDQPGYQVADERHQVVDAESARQRDIESLGHEFLQIVALDIGEDIKDSGQDPAKDLIEAATGSHRSGLLNVAAGPIGRQAIERFP